MMDCVTKEMREAHFLTTGQYVSDQEIYAWFVVTVLEVTKAKAKMREYLIENTCTS